MTDLSDVEVRVVAAIESFWGRHQKGPTYEELAPIVGMSISTTWRRVQKLIGEGIVSVDEGKHRSLSVDPPTYITWEVVMSNGNSLFIACGTEERARELAIARNSLNLPRIFVKDITKMSLSLAEIEAKTGRNFELVARMEDDLEKGS